MNIFDRIFSDVRETKEKLDIINYAGTYDECYGCHWKNHIFLPGKPGSDKKTRLLPLNDLDPDNIIVKAFDKVKDILSPNKIGVVSNGVHGLDFLLRYFPEIEKPICGIWNTSKRIMLVYEMPGNNLDCSYGKYVEKSGENGVIHRPDDSDLRYKLTNIWWRLDGESDIEIGNLHSMMKNKKYVSLPLFLIYFCGLINLYVTNLCRFEICKIDENGIDHSLNLYDALKEESNVIDIVYESVFCAEIEAFNPDIILATSNPYDYLFGKLDKKKYTLCKIPHPAIRRLSNEYQGIINIYYALQCLGENNILRKSMVAKLSRICMLNLLNNSKGKSKRDNDI